MIMSNALITADAARELLKASDDGVAKMLQCISTEITVAAKLGLSSLLLDKAIGSKIFVVQLNFNNRPLATPQQLIYIDKLVAAGFEVEFFQQSFRDGDNGPVITWHIKVSW
jgi:hypothetical protein